MSFAATHTIGARLDEVYPAGDLEGKGFELGNSLIGADGRKYVFVEASASIAALAAGREVTITEPAMTAATGAGGFLAPENKAVASGERFWARQSAL